MGVKAVKPTAGYYIFPDFEVIKENLKRRGIKTCEEMCKAILDECGVAVCWDFSFFFKYLISYYYTMYIITIIFATYFSPRKTAI